MSIRLWYRPNKCSQLNAITIYVSKSIYAQVLVLLTTLPLRVVYRAGVDGGTLAATVFCNSVSVDAVGVGVACAFSAGSTL